MEIFCWKQHPNYAHVGQLLHLLDWQAVKLTSGPFSCPSAVQSLATHFNYINDTPHWCPVLLTVFWRKSVNLIKSTGNHGQGTRRTRNITPSPMLWWTSFYLFRQEQQIGSLSIIYTYQHVMTAPLPHYCRWWWWWLHDMDKRMSERVSAVLGEADGVLWGTTRKESTLYWICIRNHIIICMTELIKTRKQ